MTCPTCDADLAPGATACAACGWRSFDASDTARETLVHGLRESLVVADRFRLVRKLGRGGMGEVWLADDTLLEQPVALKMLRPELMGDAKSIAALRKEVLIARDLHHPSIVRIHDIHREGDLYFISMEYVEGDSLADALANRGKPFTLDELQPLMEAAAEAIDYAHTKNVLHRDIKPANFLLGKDGTVKLTDFGIARAAKDTITRVTGEATSGTLLYMSPEQLLGETDKIGPRSDVYSFAVTVYELLSGEPPFHTGKIDLQILTKAVPEISHLSTYANDALLIGLAKDVSKRSKSCLAVLGDLSIEDSGIVKAFRNYQVGDEKVIGGITLIWIAPGKFEMGSPLNESGRYEDEIQHQVVLTRGFWIGKYPITRDQWGKLMQQPSASIGTGNFPATDVSWWDCQEYLTRLARDTNHSFRLATEAEWEFACRAGTDSAYCFGDEIEHLTEYAWFSENYTECPAPVGQKRPNSWGLHDMHGNVWEWCNDWYGPVSDETQTNPGGPSSGECKVLRGGAWNMGPSECRSAFRYAYDFPDVSHDGLGLRVVCDE